MGKSKKEDGKKPKPEEKKKKTATAVEVPKKAQGRVRPCSCAHEFQDKEYGRGMRVHTQGGTVTAPKFRCTVCGATKG
jgi:hypothetical protein